jgi:ABC-type molybdate transport system substrate-binding protein
MVSRSVLLAVLCVLPMIGKATTDELRVLGAGSLREAMGEVGERYKAATGTTIAAEFGPSGCCASASKRASVPICLPRPIWAIR